MSLKLLNDSPYKAIKASEPHWGRCSEEGLNGVPQARGLSSTGRNLSAAFHRTSSIPGDWVRQQSCWSSDFFFFSPSLSMLGGYKNLLCGAIFEKGPLNRMFYGSFLLLHLAKGDCTEWGFGLVYSIFGRPLSYSLSFYRDLWIITYFLKVGVEFLS